MIGGVSGRVNISTDNGQTWGTPTDRLNASIINAIIYANGVWMIGGYNGLVNISTDNGQTWGTPTDRLSSSTITEITYANGVWMIVGVSGLINTMHQHQTLEDDRITQEDINAAVEAILSRIA
jgi:photosystem II stability/assembly factor-like uncharacterized protein